MALLVIIFKIEIKYLDDRTLKAYIGVGTPKLLPTPAPPFQCMPFPYEDSNARPLLNPPGTSSAQPHDHLKYC